METKPIELKKTIEFSIDSESLINVISNFNISEGTISNPIPITSLVTETIIPSQQLPSKLNNFERGLTIKIKLANDECIPVYCKIKNQGTIFNKKSNPIVNNPWYDLFDTKDYICPPDGTMFIVPNDSNEFIIKPKDSYSNDSTVYYISYSIVFYKEIMINNEKSHYYFIIDPLAKVSSTRNVLSL